MRAIERVNVTPEIAAEWLKHVDIPNPLDVAIVNQYAKAMAAGRWRPPLTPKSPIWLIRQVGWGQHERLILKNGQHRLNACLLSNATFPAIVFIALRTPSLDKVLGAQQRERRSGR